MGKVNCISKELAEEVKAEARGKGKKGFQKGNRLQLLKIGTKYAKTEQWDNLGVKFLSQYTDYYMQLNTHLAHGGEINEQQKDFMDRYERMAEFFKPKRQKVETKFEGEIELKSKALDEIYNKIKGIQRKVIRNTPKRLSKPS